ICLKAGVGIVSGNWFDAGATTTEHVYKKAVAGAVVVPASSASQKLASRADCAGAVASAMKIAEVSISTAQLEPKMLEMVRKAMGTMSITMTNACVDDKWSLAATDCMTAAKDEATSEACKSNLTPAQVTSMTDKLAVVAKQMQEEMMKAMTATEN
nr:hypothetical protein [Kofleriaceae bacterium]